METQEKAESVALTRGKQGEPKARRGGRSAINKESREDGAEREAAEAVATSQEFELSRGRKGGKEQPKESSNEECDLGRLGRMRTGVATRATKKGGFQGYRDRQSRSEHAHALAHHVKKSLLTREREGGGGKGGRGRQKRGEEEEEGGGGEGWRSEEEEIERGEEEDEREGEKKRRGRGLAEEKGGSGVIGGRGRGGPKAARAASEVGNTAVGKRKTRSMARTRNEQRLRYISGACMRGGAMPWCDNGMARRARWMESLEHLKEVLAP
jgi:hypothetical protein